MFNPIWLRWFIDLSANLGPGGAGSGTVNAVTGTAPINSTEGNAPVLSMPAATALVDGYLSHIDWGTFNNKQPAGAYLTGNQTITLGGVLSGSGTTSILASFASTPWTGNGVNGTASGLYGTPVISVTSVMATTGNFIPATSGKGMDFSAHSSAAGATTKILVDYEEGTFTPTYSAQAGSAGAAVASNTGRYIKVGSLVTVFAEFYITNVGSWSGVVVLGGLPFTAIASVYPTVNIGLFNGTATLMSSLTGYISPGTNTATFQYVGIPATTQGRLNVSDIANGFYIELTASYRT